MDLRVIKTEKLIKDTFLELRARKPIEKIKVKELCAKAQINKSTFYAHYRDIYDLSETIEDDIVKEIAQSVKISDNKDFIKELYGAFIAQDKILRSLFSGSVSNHFVIKVKRSIREMLLEYYPRYEDNPAFDIVLNFIIYGGYYTFLDSKNTERQDVVDIIQRISSRVTDVL